jgi:methyl-accepting chemotaxis protein
MFMSVRVGLLAAFAGITVLLVLTAFAGLRALGALSEEQSGILDRTVPTALSAEALLADSFAMTGRVASLDGATDEATLEDRREILDVASAGLRARLDALATTEDGARVAETLYPIIESISGKIDAYGALSERRLRAAAMEQATLEEIEVAARDLTDLSEALVANATSTVSNMISTLYESVDDPSAVDQVFDTLDELLDVSLFYSEQMNGLKINSLRLTREIATIAAARDMAELNAAQDATDAVMKTLGRNIDSIADPARKENAEAIFHRLAGLLDVASATSPYATAVEKLEVSAYLAATRDATARDADALEQAVTDAAANLTGEIDDAQAMMRDSVDSARKVLIGASAIGVALAFLIGFFYVQRGVARRLSALTKATLALSRGEENVAIPAVSRDELGQMASALKVFQSTAEEKTRLEAAQRDAEERAEAERREMVRSLAGEIGAVVARASEGDFSHRVRKQFDDPDIAGLARDVNHLMDAADKGLTATRSALRAIADADLTHRMTGEFHGVFAELRDDTERTLSQLSELISRIRSAALLSAKRSSTLTDGATALTQRAENQAATLEETAATMEEMAGSMKSNLETLAKAEDISRLVEGKTASGEEAAQSAIDMVRKIETSSQKINDIISLIESISFQTNLLALNASVEAARAGEAGKGFSVVAAEVRQLAKRSAEGANEISALVKESAANVASGVSVVEKTSSALRDISESVSELIASLREIASAGREQSTGVEEINQSVAQMDRMTQENAHLAEQTSGVADELSSDIVALAKLAEAFKVADATRVAQVA